MTAPTCPQDYSCVFNLQHPRVIYHSTDPWWQGSTGLVAGVIMGLAICAVIAYIASLIHEAREEERAQAAHEREAFRQAEEDRLAREQHLAIEEQFTMQIDAAKGNPEMLKIVREMQEPS